MAPVAIDQSNSLPIIPLAEYIFRRIYTLGIKSIFGVPGDYNLALLEHLYSVPGLKWIGCCNELNSAYAADGYSRMMGMGVIVTTQGVGELSAINGISGSYAEHVPVLHIVGTSTLSSKSRGTPLHHIIDGKAATDLTDHYVYEKMSEHVSCKVASLNDLETAADEIDHVIETILTTKRPGFLYVPTDIVNSLIDSSNLQRNVQPALLHGATKDIDMIVSKIGAKLQSSQKPIVLADILTERFGLTSTLQDFVDKFEIPSTNSMMGKSLMNESSKTYIGDYLGDKTHKLVLSEIQKTDCLLHFGNYFNEVNTGSFSIYENIKPENIIKLNPEYIDIGGELYDVSFELILPKLLNLQLPKYEFEPINVPIEQIESPMPISQTYLLQKLQDFIQPEDIVIAETCSLMFGFPDLKLPKKSKFISQNYYLSIGYALPSSFGVGVAMYEKGLKGRLIVIQGDGAAQMTMQEWSNFGRKDCEKPLIMLLNNSGYTVERIIEGADRDYNDIRPNWKWTEIFNVFSVPALSSKVTEREELDEQLEKFGKDTALPRMLEITLDKMDVPWRFRKMVSGH